MNVKLGNFLEKLTQGHKQQELVTTFDMRQNDCENKNWACTRFLLIQKNQLDDIQKSMERFCNVLTVFGFSSEKLDLNFLKSY